jgi:imidazolonepropionase-like amidohydrolase
MTRNQSSSALFVVALFLVLISAASVQSRATSTHSIVLHAARLLEIDMGRLLRPGEVLVEGERIAEVGSAVTHPARAETIDLS